MSLCRRLCLAALSLSAALTVPLTLSAVAAPPSTSPSVVAAAPDRVRLRFDANWRFRVDAPGTISKTAQAAGDVHWNWKPTTAPAGGLEGVDSLPADLDVSGTGSGWQGAEVGVDDFDNRPGWAWFRADLGANPANAHGTLHFESVDDNCVVFLNGMRLLVHRGWDQAFDVPVGSAWKSGGPNVLVLLVQNTGGGGGIGGPTYWAGAKDSAAALLPTEAAPGFDDRGWRVVHLPHDYVVEGKFDPHGDVGHGSLPKPQAWYRKTFTLPAAYKGRSLWIDFDGVYRNSTGYLNGHRLGNQPSGYIGFRYDIGPFAHFGPNAKNVLAVHVDPRRNEGWWYEGGGIYRHVWLNAANPVHVAPWGVYADGGPVIVDADGAGATQTLPEPPAVSSSPDAAARRVRGQFWRTGAASPHVRYSPNVRIETTIANDTGATQSVWVESRVLNPQGKLEEVVSGAVTIPAHNSQPLIQRATVRQVQYWGPAHPYLYRVETRLSRQPQSPVSDTQVTTFGFRTIRFDANKGFFLNGRAIKIQGTCNHQDHAGVGIGIPDALNVYRLEQLKKIGCNAIRTSHNPPTPEVLDACDRLGILVMDETRHLGDTESPKSPRGTKADDLSELKAMIRRDRNHPSIILWSLANEEPLQGSAEGAAIYLKMKNAVHALDPTRPCSEAMNGGYGGEGITTVTDVQGINYNIYEYDRMHAQYPNLPIMGSETASTVSTRGIYENDPARGYVSAYDVNYPRWAQTAEGAWRPIAEREWMAGGFIWTGFDYKGEPTPYGWPCINSHFGVLDMCGFPKDVAFYYRAWWRPGTPTVHIAPHWNWRGKEGQPILVWIESNAAKVELFLNGQSQGVKDVPKWTHVEWNVPYAPGTLEAKAMDAAGKVIATDKVETTGAPVALRFQTDRTTLAADGEDITQINVAVVDAAGRVVPTADNPVTFRLAGPGTVAGVGNGDPSSHEPDKASARRAFNGLCAVLVQAGNQPGKTITVTASAPGLKPATVTLRTGAAGVEDR